MDIYRRNLQRTYVDHLASLIATPAANSDLPALARAELVAIGDMVSKKTGVGANAVTSAHLADLAARIEHALDNEND